MYEYERDIMPVTIHCDLRNSSYLSFTYKPNPFIDLVSTTFYQPLFRQLSDYRIMNQLILNVKLNKHFVVVLHFKFQQPLDLGHPRLRELEDLVEPAEQGASRASCRLVVATSSPGAS